MSVRRLVDENMPRCVVEMLRSRGDDALDIADSDLRGSADAHLWALAADEERIIIPAILVSRVLGTAQCPLA